MQNAQLKYVRKLSLSLHVWCLYSCGIRLIVARDCSPSGRKGAVVPVSAVVAIGLTHASIPLVLLLGVHSLHTI